jgi:hypothetical protein
MDDRPKSDRHAQPKRLIRILALLSQQNRIVRVWDNRLGFEIACTYAFEVPVDYIVIVKDLETVTDVEELGGSCENRCDTTEQGTMWHTSCNRSTPGWFLTNCRTSPFGIHSNTMESGAGSSVTPRNGTIFGCESRFHMVISL